MSLSFFEIFHIFRDRELRGGGQYNGVINYKISVIVIHYGLHLTGPQTKPGHLYILYIYIYIARAAHDA